MPITWRVGDGGRIHILFTGPYTSAEAEHVMNEIYASPGIAQPLRFLVDVRQTTPPDAEFVVNAITFWQLHVHDMWGAKIAVVTATEGQMSMANVSEQSVEWRDLPFTVRAFREADWSEAERWLAEAEGDS
jgi:hypothetical protein